MDENIKKAAKELTKAKYVVALTGAGISVESGIPPFRGKGGLWEKFDPMKYASINGFMENPGEVWEVLLKNMKNLMAKSKPNDAHKGLVQLEKTGKLKSIITQNVDGLHQKAGSQNVIEFHGTFAWNYCIECSKRYKMEDIELDEIPPKCTCKGLLRPDCVFFGEQIPQQALIRSRAESEKCDIMLTIGTSATVQPAAMMPQIAKRSGSIIIEINPEPTPLTDYVSDYFLKGQAGQIMNKLINEMKDRI